MNVIYARQPLPPCTRGIIAPHTIFLAGPTPRMPTVPSWRPKALETLASLGFTGTVFVPEDEQWGLSNVIYEEQTRWEVEALGRAQSIVVWLPRQLPDMPAFTTNTEYGIAAALAYNRTILGAPEDAVKVKYQLQVAAEIKLVIRAFTGKIIHMSIPTFNTLEETLAAAVLMAA